MSVPPRVQATGLPSVLIVEPAVHRDSRGFFLESHNASTFAQRGVERPWVQDSHSRSGRAILRGLHLQCRRQQTKLVRVTRGEVFDVAVDVRRGSPSFLGWTGCVLSEDNFRQLYIPRGFAHGFCVISETAEVQYKCDDYYDRDDQLTIAWDDPQIGIDWPVDEPLLSERDQAAPTIAGCFEQLPTFSF